MQQQQLQRRPAQKTQPKVSGLEYRYRRAVAISRSCKMTRETKALEQDIAHTINRIDQYGFSFFPNHFIRDEVLQFEAMVNQLQFITAQ